MNKLWIYASLILVCVSLTYASHNTYMSFQGKFTNSTNKSVTSGDITINISATDTCEGEVYSKTFTDSFSSEGIFDTILGNDTVLPLDYNRDYYLCVEIDGDFGKEVIGENYVFRGGQGEIGTEDTTFTDQNLHITASPTFADLIVGGIGSFNQTIQSGVARFDGIVNFFNDITVGNNKKITMGTGNLTTGGHICDVVACIGDDLGGNFSDQPTNQSSYVKFAGTNVTDNLCFDSGESTDCITAWSEAGIDTNLSNGGQALSPINFTSGLELAGDVFVSSDGGQDDGILNFTNLNDNSSTWSSLIIDLRENQQYTTTFDLASPSNDNDGFLFKKNVELDNNDLFLFGTSPRGGFKKDTSWVSSTHYHPLKLLLPITGSRASGILMLEEYGDERMLYHQFLHPTIEWYSSDATSNSSIYIFNNGTSGFIGANDTSGTQTAPIRFESNNVWVSGNLQVGGCIQYNCSQPSGCITLGGCL